jgi:hypothetical protein
MDARAHEAWLFGPRTVFGWLFFTAAAGFVNAGAVMACKSFVTHITGNVTSIAVEPPRAASYALVVAMFVGGAMFAFLVAEMLRERGSLGFVVPIIASFLMLVGIALAGKAGCFGEFGVDSDFSPRAFMMLGLLAAALGMVNAAVANATKNQLRVSHLTGPATDLAGNVVRGVLGVGAGSAVELRWAMLRFAKLACFTVGAGIAAKVSGRLQFDIFVAAAMILVVALGLAGAPRASDEADAEEGHAVDPPLRTEDGMPLLPGGNEGQRPPGSEPTSSGDRGKYLQ